MSGPGNRNEDQVPEGGHPSDQEAGVFGSLPRSRPSVRSPRRTAGPPPRSAPGAEPESAPGGQPSGEQELEALARAGVSLVGDAATLGVRLAGRAAAALRGAVERR